MARPYSVDLRERVRADKDSGMSCPELAHKYRVSESFIYKLMQRVQATGSVKPFAAGGQKPLTLAEEEEWLRALVKKEDDLTLEEIKNRLMQKKVRTSISTLWRSLERWHLPYKKKSARSRAGQAGRQSGKRQMAR